MEKKWWKESVVYQIYPRSFKDSNGDGIGDLRGIIEKVDYIKNLGVDVVWLNPVYQSPNDDNGYDISDYKNIMSEFGSMADWEELLSELHKRDIKLIMDLVVNHSSDEHQWFVESRKSKDNKYRDYYIWRPPVDGKEPNNWTSFFSGSAWKLDEATNEYYLHLFSKKQPDLNWENKTLREEVYDMMKWWLDKGVDGFRMDVINMISKEEFLPNGKENDLGYIVGAEKYLNGPKLHEYLQEMNREVLSKYDIFTVGECPGTTPKEGVELTGTDRNELSMIFQFEHMGVDTGKNKWDIKPWKLTDLKKIIEKWQKGLHGKAWNSIYLMNHDQPRAVSRFGNDKNYRVESAKMLATFTLSLQGTPYIYQGEEIGMTNTPFNSIDECKDLEVLNYYNELNEKGKNSDWFLDSVNYISRDHARTPVQWNSEENAGFTDGTPWIKINPNYKEINVETALANEKSVFYYYKKMIEIRKNNIGLVYGDFEQLMENNENIFAYKRTYENKEYIVVLNFSEEELTLNIEDLKNSEILISNYDSEIKETLKPFESRIYIKK